MRTLATLLPTLLTGLTCLLPSLFTLDGRKMQKQDVGLRRCDRVGRIEVRASAMGKNGGIFCPDYGQKRI